MGIVLAALLIANNADPLLSKPLYETGDPGSYALSIRRAAQGRELYGHYSRFGFRHPGPGYFYLEALGENLFANWTGIVPAPFNALILTVVLLTSFWYAFAVVTCWRWAASSLFLPLALGLGVCHFAAVGSSVFLSSWPPHVIAMTFLAFLVLCASVGAGRAHDLPWLIVTGGLLVHAHVAQPLFVVPLALLAYAGLLWWAGQAEQARILRGEMILPARPLSGLLAGWRAAPGSHGSALVWLGLLVLPFVLDVGLNGSHGNLAAVFQEARDQQHHRAPRTVWQSLNYFVNFGGYDEYELGSGYLKHLAAREMWGYVRRHAEIYALWLASLFFVIGSVPALALLNRAWGSAVTPHSASSSAGPGIDAAVSAAGRERFFGNLALATAAAVGLTLVWGVKQEGLLYYFKAWFNYSIYYAWCLVVAGTVCVWSGRLGLGRSSSFAGRVVGPNTAGWRLMGLGSLYAVVVGAAILLAPRFRDPDVEHPQASRLVASFREALRLGGLRPGQLVFLSFEHDAWSAATGLAVQLLRAGYQVRVPESWTFMFGEELSPADPRAGLAPNQELTVWRLLPLARTAGGADRLPLIDGYGLALSSPPVAPAPPGGSEGPDAVINFGGQGNFARWAVAGWSTPEPGSDASVTDQTCAQLQFQPVPVPVRTTVEMTFDFSPFLVPPSLRSQRCEVFFNHRFLATWHSDHDSPPDFRVSIPAAAWNSRTPACLVLRFPDATSPHDLNLSADTRPLAFSCRSISFRLTPAVGSDDLSTRGTGVDETVPPSAHGPATMVPGRLAR